MKNGTVLLIPCTVVDSRHVHFGRQNTSAGPGDELDAAFTAEAFWLLFGEDAASSLANSILQISDHVSAGTAARADAGGLARHHSMCQSGANEMGKQCSHTPRACEATQSAFSVATESLEAGEFTPAGSQAPDDMYEKRMQYFFILARGTRRVISAPARKHTTSGPVDQHETASFRPYNRRLQRSRLRVPLQQCNHGTAYSRQPKTTSPPNMSRPVSAVNLSRGCGTAPCRQPVSRSARPRSAVLMDIMSTQISGPISVSQVLRGDLADSSLHDKVQLEWGMPPLDGTPRLLLAASIKVELPGPGGGRVVELPDIEVPPATVLLQGGPRAPAHHAGTPTAAAPDTQLLHRPHTAPSASVARSSGQRPSSTTHAQQGEPLLHVQQHDQKSSAGDSAASHHNTGLQDDQTDRIKDYPRKDDVAHATAGGCSATAARRAVVRPFSCQPHSRSQRGSLALHSPNTLSSHSRRRCHSAVSSSQKQPVSHCRGFAKANTDAVDGDSEPDASRRLRSSGHQLSQRPLDQKLRAHDQGTQAQRAGFAPVHDSEASCASLALASMACTSLHTIRPPTDLAPEQTAMTVSTRHDQSSRTTATGERSWSALSLARPEARAATSGHTNFRHTGSPSASGAHSLLGSDCVQAPARRVVAHRATGPRGDRLEVAGCLGSARGRRSRGALSILRDALEEFAAIHSAASASQEDVSQLPRNARLAAKAAAVPRATPRSHSAPRARVAATAGFSRARLRQPGANNCSGPPAMPRRPCTAPVQPSARSEHSGGPLERGASVCGLTLVGEGSVLAGTSAPRAASLEGKALHRMRVRALVQQTKRTRKGGSALQRRAQDRALADFWDPRTREKIVVLNAEPRGGELVINERVHGRPRQQRAAARPASAPLSSTPPAIPMAAAKSQPAAPNEKITCQRYQNPDLWLLDATGAKADAVRSWAPRWSRDARQHGTSTPSGRPPKPGQLCAAAARHRSEMLHNRYKAMFHPLVDQASPCHPQCGQVQLAGSRSTVARGWHLEPARRGGGPGTALHRLRCVQQRRMQQAAHIGD